MKKTLILILLSIIACSASQEYKAHCYLISGLYLVEGDNQIATQRAREVWNQWPDIGQVEDVFYAYNDDPELELYSTPEFSRDDIKLYLEQGHRVVISYRKGDGCHSEPIFNAKSCDGKDIVWVYIAGYFHETI